MSHTIIAAANCPIYKDYPYLLRNLAPRNRTDGRMTVRLATLVLLAAALLAFACGSDDDAAPATGSGPRDVIAFGAEGPDGDGLYIVKPDGSGLRLLAAESGFVAFPVWSPGGGQIAYVVGVPGGVDPVLLRVYEFETDMPVTISTLAVAGQFGAPAAWSPDGRQIAFSEVAGGAPRLRVYDVGRGELIDYPRVSGRSPTWSPDGEELAFVRDGGDGGLLVMDAGGGEPEVLVNRPGRVEGPRWSPGGELIVVVAGEEVTWRSRLIVHPLFSPAYEVDIPAAEGGHGGGDPLLQEQMFSPDAPADPWGRSAGHEQGAAAMLVGDAANQSMETGAPVNISEICPPLGDARILSELT